MSQPGVWRPCETDSINDLVEVITAAAKALQAESGQANGHVNGHADTSKALKNVPNDHHGINGQSNGHTHNLSDDIDPKAALISACRTLMTKVSGPAETLQNMALIDKHNLVSLQIVNHLHIADLVPADGDISLAQIASECHVPSGELARIVRQAITYGVFHESRPGFIAHTALSRELPRLAPLLTYQLEVCFPSSLALLRWLKQRDAPDRQDTAFQIAHNTNDTWWNYAQKRPQLIEDYGKYMALITEGGPNDVSHVVNGYDWAGRGPALVIDLGGADGFVASTLARAFPNLRILVQDNPNFQTSAEQRFSHGLTDCVSFLGHSFFDPQPAIAHEADIFLLRHILHDWNDKRSLQILGELTPCLKSGASIIIADQVVSESARIDAEKERFMRALDMQMMVNFDGKERTLDDWMTLFQKADPGLRFIGCSRPAGSVDSFLEFRKE